MHVKLLQLCPTLCDPMDCSPPGSPVLGILQSRIPGGLPCPPPGYLPDPGVEPASLVSPALAGRFVSTSASWEATALSFFRAVHHARVQERVSFMLMEKAKLSYWRKGWDD